MSYWSNRQARALQALEKDETALRKRLNKLYDAEEQRLAREIAAYYKQYGNADGVIEFRTLLEQASPAQKAMIWQDWDAFAAQYPQYAHLTPTRESIYKLNRLEALQASVTYQMTNLNAQANGQLATHLAAQSTAAARMTFETLGHEYNNEIMRAFAEVNHTTAEDFSSRIWSDNIEPDTQKISDYVNNDLAQAFARGDSYERTAKEATTRFRHVEKRYLDRLIYTEGTYAFNQATKNAIQQDFDKYKYDPIEDGKTCAICRALRGKEYELKDAEAGVNFPPMHPWCRCSFTIVTPETEDERDKWVADYITKNGGDKQTAEKILARFEDKPEKKISKAVKTAMNKIKKIFKPNDIDDVLNEEELDKFLEGMAQNEDLRTTVETYKSPRFVLDESSGAFYSQNESAIHANTKDRRDRTTILAHEYGHYIDSQIHPLNLLYVNKSALNSIHFEEARWLRGNSIAASWFGDKASLSDEFLAAARRDRERLLQIFKKDKTETPYDVYKKYKAKDQVRGWGSSGVQDFLDGIGIKGTMAGHGDEYYNRYYTDAISPITTDSELASFYTKQTGKKVQARSARKESRIYDAASEAWANITAAEYAGGKDLEAVKEYMPEMYKEWKRITKEATKR